VSTLGTLTFVSAFKLEAGSCNGVCLVASTNRMSCASSQAFMKQFASSSASTVFVHDQLEYIPSSKGKKL